MKKALFLLALAGAVIITLFPQDAETDWSRVFRQTFDAEIGDQRFILSIPKYLENNDKAVKDAILTGADPAELGRITAKILFQFEMDLRGGLTLQEAKARSVQSLGIARQPGAGIERLQRLSTVRRKDEAERSMGGIQGGGGAQKEPVMGQDSPGKDQGHGK